MRSIATPPEVAERSSARRRGRRSATVAPYSPLYCAVNGFSLGAFIAGAQLPMAAPRYPAMRQRVHEFLDEVEIPLRWPTSHADYVAQSTTLHSRLLEALRERSVALHEMAGIGMMAVLLAAGFPSASAQLRRVLRKRWVPVLERHGLPGDVYQRFVRRLGRAWRAPEAGLVLTPAFDLLQMLVEPLAAEADTCFVAMPFRPPYGRTFVSYYRPALAAAGFRAVRAWGGIANEEYYPFIAPIMARCAAVLAELSTLNLNVINEVGLAHGANRPTFLVMGMHERRLPPSNLGDLLILDYDRRASGWPQSDVPRLTRFIRHQWRGFVRSLTLERVIEDNASQLVRYLSAAGLPVPTEVRRLARQSLLPDGARYG